MVGLVIFTHGNLAAAMMETLTRVSGELERSIAIGIKPGQSMMELKKKLQEAIDEVDSGDGVLVLVDLVGGTPWNLAASMMPEKRMDVLAGVNLPILIKCTLERNCDDPSELAKLLLDYGRKHLEQASTRLCKVKEQ